MLLLQEKAQTEKTVCGLALLLPGDPHHSPLRPPAACVQGGTSLPAPFHAVV